MPGKNHNRIGKTHVIADIDYLTDWLQCVCGWEGKALDMLDLRRHQKTSVPYEGETIPKLHTGKFNPAFSSSSVNLNDAKELVPA